MTTQKQSPSFDGSKVRCMYPFEKFYRISAPFGQKRKRTKIINGETIDYDYEHEGVDIAVSKETPVLACASGKVFKVGWENEEKHDQGFGYRLIIESKIGSHSFYLYYTHLSWSLVHEGQEVLEGQRIAMSGNTGRSSGPHIHMQNAEKYTGKNYDFDFYDGKEVV